MAATTGRTAIPPATDGIPAAGALAGVARAVVAFAGAALAVCACAAVAHTRVAVAGPAEPATGLSGAGAVLLRSGFEEGLAGWVQDGNAEFAADKADRHGGDQSARITNAPGAKIQYQQLQQALKGAAPGDRLSAAVWVRTRGVGDGAGAYMALEFLGPGGGRVDIAHSKVSRSSGRDGWQRLAAEAVVPKGAAATRLVLVFHAHGTAWFDDAEVSWRKSPSIGRSSGRRSGRS